MTIFAKHFKGEKVICSMNKKIPDFSVVRFFNSRKKDIGWKLAIHFRQIYFSTQWVSYRLLPKKRGGGLLV